MHKLSDLFENPNDIQNLWDKTETSDGFQPIPAGKYDAKAVSGRLRTSPEKGTPYYELTFEIVGGEFAGRRLWLSLWLTEKALGLTKSRLERVGITDFSMLESSLPRIAVCECKVVVNDNRNEVRSFKVLRLEDRPVDPFAPDTGDEGGSDAY